MQRTRLLQNLCLLSCSVAVSLFLGELIARSFVRVPEKPKVFVHEKSENNRLIYKPSPHASSYAYHVQNQINSAGFRDREYSFDKTKGIKRMVFIGDSIVYGYALESNKTLPKQLEEVFRRKGRRVEVLNLGVSGYETEQEIEFLKEVGLKYKPDIVLVGCALNDSNYASWELDLFDDLVHATVKDSRMSLYRKFLGYLFEHSRLLYLIDRNLHIQKEIKELRSDYVPIRRYLEKKNKENKDPDNSDYRRLEKKITEDAARLGTSKKSLDYLMKTIGFWADDLHSSHWNVSRRAFLELKQLSEKYSFEVVVVIFPIMQEMDKYPLESLHEYLHSEFQRMGFSVIDMMVFGKEIYRDYSRPAISGDGIHFTELGAVLAASYLRDELIKMKTLGLASEKGSGG